MTVNGVVYKHLPLEQIGMTAEQAEEWARELNDATRDRYAPATVTTSGKLAIDARLADMLDLAVRFADEATRTT